MKISKPERRVQLQRQIRSVKSRLDISHALAASDGASNCRSCLPPHSQHTSLSLLLYYVTLHMADDGPTGVGRDPFSRLL